MNQLLAWLRNARRWVRQRLPLAPWTTPGNLAAIRTDESQTRAGSVRRTLIALTIVLPTAMSCSLSRKEQGVLIGAGAGAGAGAIIGNATGSTVRGAIIGAAVGGVAGGVIGHQMDQQAKELTYELPGAVVARVGEGITVTFPEGLLFAFDSDDIAPSARENLKKFASSLSKYPRTNSLIVGHTDSEGTDQYNVRLSDRRAQAAVEYLSTQGIDRTRMRTAGRGSTEPVATNETALGRQQNRRIEIAIFADEAFRRQGQQ